MAMKCVYGTLSVLGLMTLTKVVAFAPDMNLLKFKRSNQLLALDAKPKRLGSNADGVVYVNDKCINCAACSGFAPDTFERQGGYHVVHRQPVSSEEINSARAALSACPVAAIRLDSLAERRHGALDKKAVEEGWSDQDEKLKQKMSSRDAAQPFPRPLLGIPNAYWTGHHNSASFGAVPYLIQAQIAGGGEQQDGSSSTNKWIMVDTPKFSKKSLLEVKSITGEAGPDFLFLTHVDDTADHGKWAEEFPNLKQIFHSGDLGVHNWVGDKSLEDVDVLLQLEDDDDDDAKSSQELTIYTMNGDIIDNLGATEDDVVIVHTPGHSPGSITLYHKPHKIIFTGDTYAMSALGKMTAFPRYGDDLRKQEDTLVRLMDTIDWEVVAPGHGHVRDYRGQSKELRRVEMQDALSELKTF